MISFLTDNLLTAAVLGRSHRSGRGRTGGARPPLPPHELRDHPPAAEECDAVGVPADHGPWLLARLPRAGYVFADRERWWWIVPAQSQTGIAWPASSLYAPGVAVTTAQHGWLGITPGPEGLRLRLAHCPQDGVPYTHPILLYIALCRIADVRPQWS